MKSTALVLGPMSLKPSHIRLPGSKSISNRALLLAALADNQCHLHNVLVSDDTQYMKNALITLGIAIETINPNELIIDGNRGDFNIKKADLFLGNAGTALRPLSSVLALKDGHYQVRGVARMHERPIEDLVSALVTIGTQIDYLGEKGYPPLLIKPCQYNGSELIKVKGNISSQFLTALLISLPLLGKPFTIQVIDELISKPYVDITLKMMTQFGIIVTNHQFQSFVIPANSRYSAPKDYYIESDASSASYFLAASFLTGVPLTLEGIGHKSMQGDIEFAYLLEQLGATISMTEQSITLKRDPLLPIAAFEIDAIRIPDAAMTFCIIALAANGPCTIHNIASWRVKETDRIKAMQTELQKLGAKVMSTHNRITITAPQALNKNISIDTYDDHRMAMCFALICLLNTPIVINDPECINKTFPEFFNTLSAITTPKQI